MKVRKCTLFLTGFELNIILQDIEEQFGGYPAGVLIVVDVVVIEDGLIVVVVVIKDVVIFEISWGVKDDAVVILVSLGGLVVFSDSISFLKSILLFLFTIQYGPYYNVAFESAQPKQ